MASNKDHTDLRVTIICKFIIMFHYLTCASVGISISKHYCIEKCCFYEHIFANASNYETKSSKSTKLYDTDIQCCGRLTFNLCPWASFYHPTVTHIIQGWVTISLTTIRLLILYRSTFSLPMLCNKFTVFRSIVDRCNSHLYVPVYLLEALFRPIRKVGVLLQYLFAEHVKDDLTNKLTVIPILFRVLLHTGNSRLYKVTK